MSKIAEAAFGDLFYPERPGFKEPTTSKDAARAMASSAPLLRERVFAAIRSAGPRGMTPDEAATAIGETVLAVRPRVTELSKGTHVRIIPTGERRTNASGLRAKVWRAA
ncbi:MAG TPA: hypothetical protein VN938_16370 [Xanthobacteraceae bacterium]|nr:hypothetical protein [Xanthobacteraceae bacterium]